MGVCMQNTLWMHKHRHAQTHCDYANHSMHQINLLIRLCQLCLHTASVCSAKDVIGKWKCAQALKNHISCYQQMLCLRISIARVLSTFLSSYCCAWNCLTEQHINNVGCFVSSDNYLICLSPFSRAHNKIRCILLNDAMKYIVRSFCSVSRKWYDCDWSCRNSL